MLNAFCSSSGQIGEGCPLALAKGESAFLTPTMRCPCGQFLGINAKCIDLVEEGLGQSWWRPGLSKPWNSPSIRCGDSDVTFPSKSRAHQAIALPGGPKES